MAGCSSVQTGTASPAGTPSPTPSGASPSTASGGAATTSLDPWALLPVESLGNLGKLNGPNKRDQYGARSCGFVRQVQYASDEPLSIDVNIWDTQGIDAAKDEGGGVTQTGVNGRKAVQVPGPPDKCYVALSVGAASRVDVSIISKDATKACDIASQVASKIVEPKLPKA